MTTQVELVTNHDCDKVLRMDRGQSTTSHDQEYTYVVTISCTFSVILKHKKKQTNKKKHTKQTNKKKHTKQTNKRTKERHTVI